ncbi:centrosomal protein of 44 kDa isoform X1 [Clarias gariepinus]|uniref:centrosomal protein of 44 kDa isoform X1 n=1 Tax=Clarias gariepinus TaxID=13013 RepID=UPI00234C5079|nr:centrosomal protein of 44 kDa isoform X1 [Clarias gariepinus]XP_053357399.1 centrosomal protein of 44 kDa isoform X1 [Clarias gariepinus]
MATGDVKGSLRKLQASLRAVKYPRDVDYQGLAKGDPSCCLPIVSYTFTSFSPAVAEHLVEFGVELTGKNDMSFMESVYKVLRDLFSYKPLLTRQQFLQSGFAERKIALLCDIIGFILDKHKQLTKGTKPIGQLRMRQLSRSKSVECSPPRETQRTPGQKVVSSRSLVERHPLHRSPAHTSFSSDDQQLHEDQDKNEDGRRRPHNRDVPSPPAHTECVSESRLRAVETSLQQCVCRLEQQLSSLDLRVQALEKSTAGTICIERSVWEELENRVLLLETGLTLSQDPMSGVRSVEMSHHPDETELVSRSTVAHQTSPGNRLSSSSEENIKERLERIASMMKDTSSLLKNIEPTI